jgi:hypothetical protein
MKELIELYPTHFKKISTLDRRICEIVPSGRLLPENQDLGDPSSYLCQVPGFEKYMFQLESESIPELNSIWREFQKNLVNLRLSMSEFNNMYTMQAKMQYILSIRASEMFSNLFVNVANTQLRICQRIDQEFIKKKRRLGLSSEVSYMITLNA